MECARCHADIGPDDRFCRHCGSPVSTTADDPTLPVLGGGRYRLRRFVGEGNKKVVYLATDSMLERDVAVARLRTERLDDTSRPRFLREARAMARLADHPNVVAVYDVGEHDGAPYVVTQYVAGGSLAALLDRSPGRRLPAAQAVAIARGMADALAHAHGLGVIHRDVKPANVWLTESGHVKLGDFGLAFMADTTRLTADRAMVGTPAYVAPEQALGREPEARSDLYSLGAVLYEMITGRPPFVADDAIAVVSQHLGTAPIPPSWHDAQVPRALEALTLQLLAKVPADRPSSAAAVSERLADDALLSPSDEPAASQSDHAAPGSFVGRVREMSELRATLEEALGGRGRLVMLAGDAGIGKTRIAAELTTFARLRGAQVLWGRTSEEGGLPAYWPWVQVLRSYLHEVQDRDRIRQEMGSGAADIAQVVSDVRERLPDLPPPPDLDPDHARFRLFDSIATFLRNASRRQPLVVVLDDLHWADAPSLLLLQFVARDLESTRLALITTHRDGDWGPDHPLTVTLGEVARHPGTRRTDLRGLTEGDVARYIEIGIGARPSERLTRVVHERSEGNPFFMEELVRLLAAEGSLARFDERASQVAVPEGIRSVIGRRTARLSAESRTLLAAASVIGREFSAGLLTRVSGVAPDDSLAGLEEAAAARLVVESAHLPGHWTFAHGLVRESLYENLPVRERLRLHRRTGAAIEDVYRSTLDAHAAELAFHFFEGRGSDDVEKAVEYATRAGRRSMRQLAYEHAAAHFERALHALELAGTIDEPRVCALLLDLGEAQRRAGTVDRARVTLRRAIEIARGLGAGSMLARGVLALLGGSESVAPGLVDDEYVSLLQEGLGAPGVTDVGLRASLLARLAAELHYSQRRDEVAALVSEALDLARGRGEASVHAFVLECAQFAMWWPENSDQRLALADEAIRLSEGEGDKDLAFRGYLWRLIDLLELGRGPEALGAFARCRSLAEASPHPINRHAVAYLDATRALFEGRFEEAEAFTFAAFAMGQEQQDPPWADQVFGVQMLFLRDMQGRGEEVELGVRDFVARNPQLPGWLGAHAHILTKVGRLSEARAALERGAVDDFAGIHRDNVWTSSMLGFAHAAAVLGDKPRCATLYDMLLPLRGGLVVTGNAWACYRAVSYVLGELATALERWDESETHFSDALAMLDRAGMRPLATETRADFADMLLRRGRGEDRARASALIDEAFESAEAIGMAAVAAHARRLREKLSAGPPSAVPALALEPQAARADCVFRNEGEFWTLVYEQAVRRVRDSKGMHHVAHLLRHPGREFGVRELLAVLEPPGDSGAGHREVGPDAVIGTLGDAGPAIDPQAKRAYRQRIEDLRDQLEEAERFNDTGRAEAARRELEFLTRQIAGASGLGGRDRRVASSLERARLVVTKRVKAALARIDEAHPSLGQHLTGAIRTGYVCAYVPGDAGPPAWTA